MNSYNPDVLLLATVEIALIAIPFVMQAIFCTVREAPLCTVMYLGTCSQGPPRQACPVLLCELERA